MRSTFITLLSIALASALPTTEPSKCQPGVQIISVRGTFEAPGPGIIKQVANGAKRRLPGSTTEALKYPACLYNPKSYFDSEQIGRRNLIKLIEDRVDECPDARFALLGASQGAQVVGDVLCGTSAEGYPSTTPLNKKYEKNIAVILSWGDPGHKKGEPFVVGNSTRQGTNPRRDLSGCRAYFNRWRSWCDAGDLACDSGDDFVVHLGYFERVGQDMINWVVSTAS